MSPRRVMMATDICRGSGVSYGLYGQRRRRPALRAFTLTELMIVIGLIAVLVSLLLPVISRVRSTAAAVSCMSNLRVMGTGWTMHLSEERGKLIDFVWYTPDMPDMSWNGYWLGALDRNRVRGSNLLCPAAREPLPTDETHGYGDADHAWTGRYENFATAVKYNDKTYRESSYGYNRYLGSAGGFGPAGSTFLSDVKTPSNVPVFVDCAYGDVRPANGTPRDPVKPPANLHGSGVLPGTPEHWKILLARHGRGVNVSMADGSAAWVRLEDLYLLNWKADWDGYRLTLPSR
jgi:prepilin-type processing-associated H-X9-DG protein/prepilin-type N-terminal cleavage/methylation domain-containing protein